LPPLRTGTKHWKRTMVTWATGEALNFFLAIYLFLNSYDIVLHVKRIDNYYSTKYFKRGMRIDWGDIKKRRKKIHNVD